MIFISLTKRYIDIHVHGYSRLVWDMILCVAFLCFDFQVELQLISPWGCVLIVMFWFSGWAPVDQSVRLCVDCHVLIFRLSSSWSVCEAVCWLSCFDFQVNSLSPKRPHPSHPGQWFIVSSRASPLTNMCVSRQPYCREEKKTRCQ